MDRIITRKDTENGPCGLGRADPHVHRFLDFQCYPSYVTINLVMEPSLYILDGHCQRKVPLLHHIGIRSSVPISNIETFCPKSAILFCYVLCGNIELNGGVNHTVLFSPCLVLWY